MVYVLFSHTLSHRYHSPQRRNFQRATSGVKPNQIVICNPRTELWLFMCQSKTRIIESN